MVLESRRTWPFWSLSTLYKLRNWSDISPNARFMTSAPRSRGLTIIARQPPLFRFFSSSSGIVFLDVLKFFLLGDIPYVLQDDRKKLRNFSDCHRMVARTKRSEGSSWKSPILQTEKEGARWCRQSSKPEVKI